MSSQTLPNETISKVAAEITKAIQGITAKDADRRDAQKYYTDASEGATSARENFLVTLSEISARDHWSLYDIEEGAKKALSSRNDKDNSIKTFSSELQRACHPSARQHVRNLSVLATTVWDNETALDKKLPRPCRTAFARKYHLLQRMIGEAIETKRVLGSTHDVVQFALAHDPKNNPDRVFKKFKLLRDQLRELADAFPLDEIIHATEDLREVTLGDFKTPGTKPAKPAPETSAETADALEQVSASDDTGTDDIEPAMGVSDLLDEALKDIV